MRGYPGGKGNSFRHIVNQMPPHATYVELFAGMAAVLRNKRPAMRSIAIDVDPAVLATLAQSVPPGTELELADAIAWLDEHGHALGPDTLIYADPPYIRETRSSGRKIYAHEFDTVEEHRALLERLASMGCMVAITGYRHPLYDSMLAGWRLVTFTAQSHGGQRTECLWTNYPQPTELHDYRYLGANFRERERIKRKKLRWVAKLRRMNPLERWALLDAINEAWPGQQPPETAMPAITNKSDDGHQLRN